MSKWKIIFASLALIGTIATASEKSEIWQQAAQKRNLAAATYERQAKYQEELIQVIGPADNLDSLIVDGETFRKLSDCYDKAADFEEKAFREYWLAIENLGKSATEEESKLEKEKINEQTKLFKNIAYAVSLRASNFRKSEAEILTLLSNFQLETTGNLEGLINPTEQERLKSINAMASNINQAALYAENAFKSYLAAADNLAKIPANAEIGKKEQLINTDMLRERARNIVKESEKLYGSAALYFESTGNLTKKVEAERKRAWCLEQLAGLPTKK